MIDHTVEMVVLDALQQTGCNQKFLGPGLSSGSKSAGGHRHSGAHAGMAAIGPRCSPRWSPLWSVSP